MHGVIAARPRAVRRRPTPPRLALPTLVALLVALLTQGALARPVAAQAAPACPGGYAAAYFANRTLTGTPALERCDAAIDNDWATGAPAGTGVGPDDFSVRWVGTRTFTAGTHRFTTISDDGVRLYVDGTRVIDHWTDHGTATDTVDRALTAGDHEVKLEYYERGGRAVAKLSIAALADTTPPGAPQSLTATGGNATVALTWSAPGDTDLAGYRVYRSTTTPVTTSGTPLSGATPVTGTAYTDATAANGTTYHYAVVAVDGAGNVSPASNEATATPAAPVTLNVKVDFGDQATAPATGYAHDYGQAYAARTGADQGSGLTFGWVTPGTTTPVDLVGNGRNRAGASGVTETDPRLLTLMHMQLPAGAASGVHKPGSWELAVPDGAYTVTVAAGDAGTAVDSAHWVNVEDQNAVAKFVPTSGTRFATATRTVLVSDGRLTISPLGGTNTKLDYVDVTSVPGYATSPNAKTPTPANLTTGVSVDAGVTAELRLPNAGVDTATLTASTVTLTRVPDGQAVAVETLTSGGGDVLSLKSTGRLAPDTTYRFSVTSGLRDLTGKPFLPWSSVFTTGATPPPPGGPVAFDKTLVASGEEYTSTTFGPDGKLYAATLQGKILRWPVNADGTLGTVQEINTVTTHDGGQRTILGLTFDPTSTAGNLILWITDNYYFTGANAPDWSSKLARLTGPDLGLQEDVLVGLPRSIRDHETNSIAFGPDGALYVNQGSNSATGAPDTQWGNRPERVLNAATLRLDLAKLPPPAQLPLNVKTEEGGTYDPYAAGAPLTIHATGVRNAYDLLWHSNGNLYAATNGSAAGGNVPATPATLPPACATTRPDLAANGPYTGPQVPGITSAPEESDWLFREHAGGYYGHPNPARCEWVINGGNPTAAADPFEMSAYPVGVQPDRNYRQADVYDAGLHASMDGLVEYRNATAFGGALKGKIVAVRYSQVRDLVILDPSGPGGTITSRTTGTPGFTDFSSPLDVTENPATGQLYVTEHLGKKLTLLTPRVAQP